jgi:hypothetical protein
LRRLNTRIRKYFMIMLGIRRVLGSSKLQPLYKSLSREFAGIMESDGGYGVLLLILGLVLTPLQPYALILLILVPIYLNLRVWGVWLIYLVIDFYVFFFFIDLRFSLILLALYILSVLIYAKRIPETICAVFLSAISYWVLSYSRWFNEYVSIVLEYFKRVRILPSESMLYDFTLFYLVVLSTIIYMAIIYIPIIKNRAGSLAENPELFPTLMFLALLVYTSFLIAIGRDIDANKYAQLAYYSLLVAVALGFGSVLKTSNIESEGE